MAKSKTIPKKYQIRIDDRKSFHLSNAQIQMDRELGMNPKNFDNLNNYDQEIWKEPLPDFIETLYYKTFKKEKPENIKSIEQIYHDHEKKNIQKMKQKYIIQINKIEE